MKLALALLALVAADDLTFGADCTTDDNDCETGEVCCTLDTEGETNENKVCLVEDDAVDAEEVVDDSDSTEYTSNSCYEEASDSDSDDAATALYAGAAALAVAASLF
jgi:hypothetical protein